MEDLGAAFGFYPQLNRIRRGSPLDSANLPIDVLRGRLAGLLGAPADIANLLRSPSPTEMFGDVSYDAPAQFPYTTEKFLKELPLAPTSRVGQAAGQVASFVPLNPMPVVRGVQKVGQVVGEELAATMLGQRPNSMMSKVVPQPLFAVPPEQGLLSVKTKPIENLLQVKPQAPMSDIGFYSAAEQAALNLQRNKGTGESFLNDLMKGPDVKKEELQFTGLSDFLAGKKDVTKQEVQDFLANNRIDVKEVQLGGPQSFDKPKLIELEAEYKALKEHPIDAPSFGQDKYDEMIRMMNIRDQSTTDSLYRSAESATRAAQRAQSQGMNKTADKYFKEAEFYNTRAEKLDLEGQGMANPPKYDKYQLPLGENYREILLTLPVQAKNEMRAYAEFRDTLYAKYGKSNYQTEATEAELQRLSDLSEATSKVKSPYRSSHFDEPNILAHMRVNDRIDADGKKMLLIEEIQSDWHQAGREKGYNTPEIEAKRNELRELSWPYMERNQPIPPELKEQIDALPPIMGGVPNAPFKDNWYQLTLKRAIKYAADNGYERIGLTTGKQQAERFDLSKQIKTIIYSEPDANGLRKVEAITPSGDRLLGKKYSPQEIQSNIGKEMADKIKNSTGEFDQRTGTYALSGLDLQVGGEGMKKYYDEIYPKFLDKYGKKFDAKVGETRIKTGRGVAGGEPVNYIDITPKMKEATSKGQPLFAVTPALPLGATSLLDEEKRKEIQSLLDY